MLLIYMKCIYMYVFGSQEHCIVSQTRNYCYSTFNGAPPSGRVECVCEHHLLSIKLDEVFLSYGVTMTTCIRLVSWTFTYGETVFVRWTDTQQAGGKFIIIPVHVWIMQLNKHLFNVLLS
jgi:hypothetical protein